MDIEWFWAHLTRDPWHLTVDQIANLTPRQFHRIYNRDLDKDGPNKQSGDRYIDLFKKSALAAGKTMAEIKEKWIAEFAAEHGSWED